MSAYRKNVSEGVFAYTDEADKMFMIFSFMGIRKYLL